MKTTPAHDDFPAIEWESTNRKVEEDPEERSVMFEMEGTSSDGRIWAGIGTYVCGECEVIDSIEEVTPKLVEK